MTAPATSRIVVNELASISRRPNARRVRIEFDANATRARLVRPIVSRRGGAAGFLAFTGGSSLARNPPAGQRRQGRIPPRSIGSPGVDQDHMAETETAVEQLYREQSSRILAVLVRLFGARNLQLAEDVLQEAFRKALVTWKEEGVPDNPAAWIMAAAKNQAVDVIRGQRTQRRFSQDLANYLESGWTLSYT